MADYVIHLGVDVDLAGLRQKINNAKIDPIKVNLNVSDFSTKINEINRALRKVGFGSAADEITKDLDKMNIAVTKATSSLKKNGNIAITVNGVDELNRAVTLVKEYKKVNISGNKFKLESVGNWSKFSQSFKTETDEINNAFNQLKQKQKELASLSSKLVGLDSKKDISVIKELTSQYKNLREEIVKLYSDYGDKFSPAQNTELSKSLQDAENKVKQLKLETKDEIQFKIDTGDFDKEINDIETKLKQMTNLPEKSKKELQNNVKYLKSLRTQMKNSLKAADKEKDPDKAVEKINKAIELQERYDKLLETTNNKVGINARVNKDETSKINDNFNKIKKARQEIGDLEVKLIGAKAKGDLDTVRDINDEIARLKANLETLEADNIGAKFTDEQKSELRELRKQNQYNKKQAQNAVNYKENEQKAKDEAREVNDAYNSIYNTKKRIGELEVKLIGEKDTKKAREFTAEIDRLTSKLETLEADNIGAKFTKKQNSALDELEKQIDFNKKQAQNQVDYKLELDYDKEKIKDTNDAFNELKKTVTAIGNLEIDLFKAELEDDARAIKDIEARLDKLRAKRDQIKDDFGSSFTDKQNAALKSLDEDISFNKNLAIDDALNTLDNSMVASVKKDMNELTKLWGQIKNIEADIGKLEFVGDGDTNKIANLRKELQELQDTYNKLKQNLDKKILDNKDIIPQSDIDNFNTNIEAKTKEAEKSFNRFKSEYADLRAELAQEIKFDFDSGKFDDQFDSLKRRFEDLTQYPDNITKAFNELKDAYIGLSVSATPDENGVINEEKLIEAQERYANAAKKTNNILRQQERIEKDIAEANRVASSKESLSLDMQNWLKNNTKAAKKYGDAIKELDAQLDKLQSDNKLSQSDVNKTRASFNQYAKQATLDGLTGLTWFDAINTKFKQYASYFSVAEVFMYAEQALTDMFEQVKLIDSAMTELKKVTDETDASYERFLTNAASRAKEIGTTIDGLVESTADFARLGYEFDEAAGLAEVANIYTVVGDEIDSVETATESLVSTLAAFKGEMGDMSDSEFAMSIVDKFNEVSNNFSISSGGIGKALQRSASSLATANNTIDESIALITSANTVVQDPEKVGRLMPTIKMAISVKIQRWTRPRKDFISIFSTYQLGRVCVFLCD